MTTMSSSFGFVPVVLDSPAVYVSVSSLLLLVSSSSSSAFLLLLVSSAFAFFPSVVVFAFVFAFLFIRQCCFVFDVFI